MNFSNNDYQYMQRAIELAKKGEYTTSPNPMVGCVLVKDGTVVGEGWHQKAGLGHAEVNALAIAGSNASQSTAYVTLEPCSHFGRTPPCSKALIEAGVKEVVIAMQDPNPQVSGRGIRMLEEAGIKTKVGLLEASARQVNVGFIKRMETGIPRVICKLASSLDGKIAMKSGESKWITSAESREDVQRLRARSCAVISGADTVITDDARLTVRYQQLGFAQQAIKTEYFRQPIRIVIDSQYRLHPDLALFNEPSPIILIRINGKTQQEPTWQDNVSVVEVDAAANGKVDLAKMLEQLASHGVNNLLVEAGGKLASAFIQAQLVDELWLYQAPKLMGAEAISLLALPGVEKLAQAQHLAINDIRKIGADIRIRASFNKQ
ncbi:bifunctional diaminohydroxyphosphoribosylaminopyrimidine deaminase/5-amino-6-(5-phosphoribosylamino)uracil reductase RibD [Thalassotalea sp. PS06]|uniref:bifunctional diaminohydroxyphosphoribosylaminopyrimidine deaminase/5-amino-6-(5-phosphoribosylamino)uracil reductase RibD n=1 Tax=Thalassotalea sp. PS06 TaxID=2594005 RepID=UPI0028C505F3|nr:bifunctional diaminohydroxyphosphoribosylaminopyrimidine deaminase/5-amino-6-(5-phosphoribosylamino)uracil reductase RibD [Thalassotalea sp. PS06]